MKHTLTKSALIALTGLAGAEVIAQDRSFEGAARDAWLTGKVETVYILNEHLNPFEINTDVENGVVRLTGTVESDIDRELAGELAENVDGVVEVRNDLVVDAEIDTDELDSEELAEGSADADDQDDRRDFGNWVDDATTTAAVKSRLIGNANTKGLEIDVDTRNDVVTLSGRVGTSEEKDLAEQLALNTGDVEEVRNNLVVDPE